MKATAKETAVLGDLNVEYEKFFNVSLDMLCISSYDGHFKKVNPAFQEVLGFSAEELCTKSYLDFIHPDDIERTTNEVQKQLLTKQHVLSFENRYRCIDGTYKWLSWKSAPVGEFMYAAARDVTESKLAAERLDRAKEALEVANRDLESFSYSVAHDLRTPTRAILGFSTLVLEDEESSLSNVAKEYLARVTNASKKMGVLIDGLLNLSKMARQDLAKRPVDLSAMAQEAAEELRLLYPNRSINFVVARDTIVNGDPDLLRVVLNNLIGNAWKYSSKSKRDVTIEFGCATEDGHRALFVRDNGTGFDMKHAKKLFGVFQRLHTDAEFEGTGIGLATVQRIIQRHGGRVWAEAAPDKGATFYFTIQD